MAIAFELLGTGGRVLKGTNYFMIIGDYPPKPWFITDGTLANTKPGGTEIIAYKILEDGIVVVDNTSSGLVLKLVRNNEVTTITTLLPQA